jgi:hypothetical protein
MASLVSNQTITYVVGGGCAFITIIAFTTLVLVPAVSSYRGGVARIGAALLSLYILAAFLAVGILAGALIIYEWPRYF